MTHYNSIVKFAFITALLVSCNIQSNSNQDVPGLSAPTKKSTFVDYKLDNATQAIKLTLWDLEANYKLLQGKSIETEGTFRYGFEHCYIFTTSAFDKHNAVFWIDIDGSKLSFQQGFNKMSGKHIRIKGMVDTANQGHLNGYPAAITKIYFWEVTN